MNKVIKVIAVLCTGVLLISSLAACGGEASLGEEKGTIFVDEKPTDLTEKDNESKETTAAGLTNKHITESKKPVAEQGVPVKNFEHNGLSIRLPESFVIGEAPTTVAYFENKQDNIAIGARKQAFDDEWNTASSLNSFVKKYSKQYNIPSSASVLQPRGDYSYLTYETTVEEFTYFCITGFWMGSDGIWSVTFSCEKRYENDLKSQMLDWADTVKVK